MAGSRTLRLSRALGSSRVRVAFSGLAVTSHSSTHRRKDSSPFGSVLPSACTDVDFPSRQAEILVTQGSQHGLSTLAAVLVSRGEEVLLEQPVYPGALQAFSLAEAKIAGLAVTETGWALEGLNATSSKAIYVISHHQNPTGRRATAEQKAELAAFAERTGTFVIEDDAYGELAFDDAVLRPLVADCPNLGVLVGSFSKTLSPGLRLGYVVVPRVLRDVVVKTLQATALQPGTLTQYLVDDLLGSLDYDAHLTELRRCYGARATALSRRLESLGWPHLRPAGGFFLWVETRGLATEMATLLAKQGLIAVPESAFRCPSLAREDRHLRLAFSRYLDDDPSRNALRSALSAAKGL
ncbi:MAG: PLP-dependent aminotransferase family protein [Polyangiaceae bacterium]